MFKYLKFNNGKAGRKVAEEFISKLTIIYIGEWSRDLAEGKGILKYTIEVNIMVNGEVENLTVEEL